MSNRQLEDMQEEHANRHLARVLGITYEELCELDFDIDDNVSNDGMVYSHIVTFKGNLPVSIMNKIDGLSPNNSIEIETYNEPDHEEFD